MAPYVLGISASHNGAACLLHGDMIVAAVQEERLTRVKRDRIYGGVAHLSVRYCLQAAGITAAQLDLVVISVQGNRRDVSQNALLNGDLLEYHENHSTQYIPHHLAHAYSAYAQSGFESSGVLVIDGAGSPARDLTKAERTICPTINENDVETVSLYLAQGTSLAPLGKIFADNGETLIHRPPGMSLFRSLGAIFQAASRQIFGEDMEAGKVMGLAPYGASRFGVDKFFTLEGVSIDFHDDVPSNFNSNERWPESKQQYCDLARSSQDSIEYAIHHLAKEVRRRSRSTRLCYAGGVALNGIANERLYRSELFDDIFIPPAAEDSGPALGAAYYGLWKLEPDAKPTLYLNDSLGVVYEPEAGGLPQQWFTTEKPRDLISSTVQHIENGEVLGWFQGGSELGPRALGQRSIFYDARRSDAKSVLNSRIKRREEFRPFAPVCLEEEACKWFDFGNTAHRSPYMLRVIPVIPDRRQLIPGVVHIDGSARVQTVAKKSSPLLHSLLTKFNEVTDVPILLNTSFNVAGEPIVETPEDALLDLLLAGIDRCVIGDTMFTRSLMFLSIMDATPAIAANRFTIEGPRPNGGDYLFRPSQLRAFADVSTPWGNHLTSLSPLQLAIVDAVDGYRNGHQVLEKVRKMGGGGTPVGGRTTLLERSLENLVRRRVIRLRLL